MKPNPRLRTTMKWASTATAVLLLAAWGASERWWVTRETTNCTFAFTRGGIVFIRYGWKDYRSPPDWYAGLQDRWPQPRMWWPAWSDETAPTVPDSTTIASASGKVHRLAHVRVAMPYWPLAAAAVVASAVAWGFDRRAARRAREHRCRTCGYARTGLMRFAVCPECGSTSEHA